MLTRAMQENHVGVLRREFVGAHQQFQRIQRARLLGVSLAEQIKRLGTIQASTSAHG